MEHETRHSGEHLSGYQVRDHEVVDYSMYRLGGTGLSFRGPPLADVRRGSYIACVGAAQTFGCFCERPYPALLAESLGVPALNLGYGGAGPEFFLRQDRLLPWLNGARLVVLQVMSARSQSNPLYDCGGLEYVRLRADGRRLGAQAAFRELLEGSKAIRAALDALPGGGRVGRKLANLAVRPRARRIVADTRAAWVQSNLDLIARIEVPVILFWFSTRPPAYREDYGTVAKLFGAFPHLVTPAMLEPIRDRVAGWIECVTSRGSPQPLISRFTGRPVTVRTGADRPDLAGEPWRENRYYPSPEMHEDAAAALATACRDLLPAQTRATAGRHG